MYMYMYMYNSIEECSLVPRPVPVRLHEKNSQAWERGYEE